MALWFGTISLWNKTSGTQRSIALPGQEQYGNSNDESSSGTKASLSHVMRTMSPTTHTAS